MWKWTGHCGGVVYVATNSIYRANSLFAQLQVDAHSKEITKYSIDLQCNISIWVWCTMLLQKRISKAWISNHSHSVLLDLITDTYTGYFVNLSWPSDAIWQHRSRSKLAQVMACCLTASSHYLNQCWLIINGVLWHSPKTNLTGSPQVIIPWKETEMGQMVQVMCEHLKLLFL